MSHTVTVRWKSQGLTSIAFVGSNRMGLVAHRLTIPERPWRYVLDITGEWGYADTKEKAEELLVTAIDRWILNLGLI